LAITTKLLPEDQEALMLWPEKRGIPIFPADSCNKGIHYNGWQEQDFSKVDFRKEMLDCKYDNGAAARTGKTLNEGIYAIALDFDHWDAVIAWFGSWENVVAHSKKSLVEWHKNQGKIHVILFANEPIPNKHIYIGPNKALLEVRCDKQALFISPSAHRDGNKYEPLGTTDIITLQSNSGLLQLKAKIDSLSSKYMSDEDKQRYYTWLEDDNTIIGEGEGRHDTTKDIVCSYFWKYSGEWLNLSDDERFSRAWQWHLKHCVPPRTRQHFDDICKWVIEKHRVNRDKNHEALREERRQQDQQQQQQQHVKGSNPIADNVLENLNPHKWAISSYKGPTFHIAHGELNQTVDAAQYEHSVGSGDNKIVYHYLQIRDIYINAIPIEITKYEDPISNTAVLEQKYKIKFKSSTDKILTMPEPMTLEEIMVFLNGRSLICQSVNAKAALSNIIQAFERSNEIKICREIEAPGFFLVDDKIVTSHMEIKEHSIEEIRRAALFVNELVSKFHRTDVISTTIHWGVMAPFNNVLKQYTKEMAWMQWLGFSGSTQVGKSTHGRVACGIWGYYNSIKYNVQFTSVNTKATLGKKLSQSTLPLNIQETDDLVSEEMRGMRDMVKGCVQGMVSRSKYVSMITYADIPCLGTCIFSSNPSFPEDPGYRSKFIYITCTANDRFWNMQQQIEFNGFISKGLGHLKVLGDFVAKQLMDNPSILLKENIEECDWKTSAIEVLQLFYRTAGLEIPNWIGLFVTETNTTSAAIEDAKESAYFQLVGMFQQAIIDGYRKDPKHSWDPDTKIYKDVDFHEKLRHCFNEHLVPYLWERPGDHQNLRYIVITSEVMSEIKRRKIPNITSIKALADEIPGFSYGAIKVGGKTKRAIFGRYSQFETFVRPEIDSIEEQKGESLPR
jgi:Bifunctional DNA primase/polymerase, N-terminal